MTSQEAPIFITRNLTKEYQMGEVKIQALRGVNLELRKNEFIVLLGASGSGKSTLLNLLGGLDTPSSGEISYRDHILSQANDKALTTYRREHVGFVFQFYNLISNLTAQENVELVTDIADNPMDSLDALTLVGLKDRKDFFPSQLSGGEQQGVAIARAIDKVHRELGTLVVVITHNSAIAGLADRVLHLRDGLLVKEEYNANKISIDEVFW